MRYIVDWKMDSSLYNLWEREILPHLPCNSSGRGNLTQYNCHRINVVVAGHNQSITLYNFCTQINQFTAPGNIIHILWTCPVHTRNSKFICRSCGATVGETQSSTEVAARHSESILSNTDESFVRSEEHNGNQLNLGQIFEELNFSSTQPGTEGGRLLSISNMLKAIKCDGWPNLGYSIFIRVNGQLIVFTGWFDKLWLSYLCIHMCIVNIIILPGS